MLMERIAMSIYLGIGCIFAAVVLWKNYLNLKDDASPVIIVADALLISVFWGLAATLWIFAYPAEKVNDSRWGQRWDKWIKEQYNA